MAFLDKALHVRRASSCKKQKTSDSKHQHQQCVSLHLTVALAASHVTSVSQFKQGPGCELHWSGWM